MARHVIAATRACTNEGMILRRKDWQFLTLMAPRRWRIGFTQYGLLEELSIAANYARDPLRKDRGYAACNSLALNRTIPAGPRDLAWSNLFFYYQMAGAMMPSFASVPVGFAAPDGYRVMNPSVTRFGEEIVLVQRTVNYTMTEDGDGLNYRTPEGAAVHTRNFLLRLVGGLDSSNCETKFRPPADMPEPISRKVLGFEDMRLFGWRDQLWCSRLRLRERTPDAWCEQVLARIDCGHSGARAALPTGACCAPTDRGCMKKNWMPRVAGDTLQFIYLCDPTRLVDEHARTIAENDSGIAAKNFRGGSQAIDFDGGWLVLIHEVQWRASLKRRFYHHRFVWFDAANVLRSISRPFFLNRGKASNWSLA